MKATTMVPAVGVRELRARLGAILKLVRAGTPVRIAMRRRPFAVVVPLGKPGRRLALEELAREGRIAWKGGKPRGAASPARVRGPAVADAVVEDRR